MRSSHIFGATPMSNYFVHTDGMKLTVRPSPYKPNAFAIFDALTDQPVEGGFSTFDEAWDYIAKVWPIVPLIEKIPEENMDYEGRQ